MKPTIGRIVHYTLSQHDADQINRRRTTGPQIKDRILVDRWPIGAQAHIGNPVSAGDVFPMVIVKVNSHTINGRVWLDGTDDYWVQYCEQALFDSMPPQGFWFWPPRE